MHHTDHAPARSETDPPRPQQPSARPSPIVGFFVALALALVGWGVFWLTTRNEATPDPGPDTNNVGASEGIQLTDEQAIARLGELTSTLDSGIRNRDSSRVSRVFTQASPEVAGVLNDIDQLRADDVIDKSQVVSLKTEVISSNSQVIRILEVIRVRFCFTTEEGQDVSQGPAAIEQEGIWIMRWEGEQWLLHDAIGEHERVVDRSDARCN